MKSTTAIGYGRTSSESGEDRASLSVQHADFDAACKANGWQSLGWVEDKDTSGRCYPVGAEIKKYDAVTSDYLSNKPKAKQERQGLAKALSSGAAILWVRDSTRFARPLSGSMLAPYLRGELQSRKITLWAGNVPVDYSQFATVLTETIKDLSEDHGIKTKIAQSKASIRAKRDKGEVYRNPEMFGFRSAGHGKVAGVASELDTVKLIYRLFLDGQGLNAIARMLNADKVPTMTRGAWAFNSVRKVLSRPLYAGYQTDSKRNLVESPIYAPLAVVTLSDYHKAQAILSGQSRPKWQSKYVHPLQGLIYCGYCGHQMGTVTARAFDTKEPQYYYRCDWSSYKTKSDAGLCRRTLIRETLGTPATVGQKKGYLSKEVEHKFGTGLIEFLYPFVIPGYVAALKAKAAQGDKEARRKEVLQQLESLRARQAQRYLDKENGLLDADTYSTLAKQLMSEKTVLETESKSLEKLIQEVSGFSLSMKDLSQLETITASEYAQLIKQVISKVLIYSDKIEVVLKDSENTLTFERVPDRNARLCPTPVISLPVIKPTSKTVQTDKPVLITWQYKSAVSDPDCERTYLISGPVYHLATCGNNYPSQSTLKKRARLTKRPKPA